MLTPDEISAGNALIMERLSAFLSDQPAALTAGMVHSLSDSSGISEDYAYSILLADALGLVIDKNPRDRALFEGYFPGMLHRLNEARYQANPYYQSVLLPPLHLSEWELTQSAYQPFELFVCDDLLALPDGRILPQLGYFPRAFPFPVLKQNGREWMMITPNEINTMQAAIAESVGKVLTFGLGLGYFAFMVSLKSEVASVTVVERDAGIIRLFSERILPKFPQRKKLRLVQDDAFEYASTQMGKEHFDFVFTDLWHDPSDGVPLYLRMKLLEQNSPRSTFRYWIERTLRCYL